MAAGSRRSSVAEHWQLKPEALGSTPGDATFLSCPLPFQRSTESDGPDCVFQLDTISFRAMEESRPSDSSPCCDYSCDLSHMDIKIVAFHLQNHLTLLIPGNQTFQLPTPDTFFLFMTGIGLPQGGLPRQETRHEITPKMSHKI